MIIDGIVISDSSGFTLISRLNVDFDNLPIRIPFLHPFPSSSISSNFPDISCMRLMGRRMYYSKSDSSIFVVIVTPKELNVQKVGNLIDKIKDHFKDIYSMFLKSGNRSNFPDFEEVLDETLKDLSKWEPQFRWIPQSLSSQPFFQQLDPTSLTAVTNVACPFCGVQSLVVGKDKETKTEHVLCVKCENRIH